MKNSLQSTTSGYLNAYTSKTLHSCSNWLNSCKAGASFWLVLFVVSLASSPGLVYGQAAANIDQIRNGGATSPLNPPAWVNGNANAVQAHYQEGNSVGYRMVVTDLGTNVNVVHTLEIEWDVMQKGKHALDFITHYQNLFPHNTADGGAFNHNEEVIQPLFGVTMNGNQVVDNSPDTEPIPKPNLSNTVPSIPPPYNAFAKSPSQAFDDLAAISKEIMTMYNAGSGDFIAVNPITYVSQGNLNAQSSSTRLKIQFTSSNPVVVFAWGGHIASQFNYGAGESAVFIKGSPYHMRLVSIDGKGGNQDRALAAAAVTPVIPTECNVAGPDIICRGDVNPVYSVQTNVSGASYSWALSNVVPSGTANIVGSNTGTSVEVNPGTATSFRLTVTIDPPTGPNKDCEIDVTVEDVTANASVNDELNCLNDSVQIFGSGSNNSFSWTGPNNFATTEQNPYVQDPGVYYLTVVSASGTCSAIDSVEVIENKTAITVALGDDRTISCDNPTAMICPDVLPTGINYTFSWTGPNNFVSSDSCITVGKGGGGEYILVVTNGLNGCTGSDTINVIENFTDITVALGDDRTISCDNPTAMICPDVLPTGINYTFSWTGPNNFVSSDSCITVGKGGGGEYILVVTNGLNGCTGSDTINVIENFTDITVALGDDRTISCDNPTAMICPDVLPTGINYTFSWTGPNNFVSSDSCITVGKGGGGEYILVVTNGLNGCTGSDTINVIENFTDITVALGDDRTISCDNPTAMICPDVLPTGINYTFSWTGPNNFVSSDSCITVGKGGGGEYILVVTNGLNGCIGSDTINVIENFTDITVALGDDRTISCDNPTAMICPDVLPTGINYTFSWTGPNNFVSSDSCITVGKGGGGEYILVVTNGLNGCIGSDTINVIENFTDITVALGADQTINCADAEAEICPGILPAGINYTFSWTGPNNFVSSDSCITVKQGEGGEYILVVTNGLNGCTGSDTIQVNEDFDKPNVGVGGPYNIACGQTSIQLNGTSTNGVSFEWKVVSGSVVFSSSTDEDPTATVSSVSATVRLIVTGANGCIDSADVNITKQVCGDKHCTLTQGAYGNANGKFCGGPRRLELINNLLAQGTLTIGAGSRTIYYTAGQAQCVIDAMPAGGTPAALPINYGNRNGCSNLGSVISKNKRFNNVFIGQVLALSFNSRLDNTLSSVELTSTITTYKASDCGPNATPILNNVMTRTIPQSVLTYLGANHTVADLLALANDALGGVFVPGPGKPSISDINDAVSAINEVFDECRILANAPQSVNIVKTNIARTSGPGGISATPDKFVKAYPNPFTDKATIELMTAENLHYSLEMYDINGRLVSRLSEGTTQAGKVYNFEISAGNLPEGVYLVRFVTDRYVETLKVIYKK